MDLSRASNATEVPVNAQKPGHDAPSTPPVTKSADEWKATLTPEQYAVLREHGTEPRGTSPLNKEKRDGMFRCAGCGQQLFASGTKFDSGTGWPSFDQAAAGGGDDEGRPQLRHDAHGGPLQPLRRSPRARVPGWSAHRPASATA